MTETRRYELLFGLLLNSGLRISEALGLKVADVRLVDGTAKSVRVIGKGDQERLVPLPGNFGAVFGFWLKDRPKGDAVGAAGAAARQLRRGVRVLVEGSTER
jgi:integrase/recombinase XerD